MNSIDILCNVFYSSDFRKTNLTENSRGAGGVSAHPGISTKWKVIVTYESWRWGTIAFTLNAL